jgi:hypothetical protein
MGVLMSVDIFSVKERDILSYAYTASYRPPPSLSPRGTPRLWPCIPTRGPVVECQDRVVREVLSGAVTEVRSVRQRVQKHLRSCHVSGRWIALDENVKDLGKVRFHDARRSNNDDLANTPALCSVQPGIDMPCIIAATGETIDRPHLLIAMDAVDRHFDLRTIRAAIACNVKHLAVITDATRVFQCGVIIELTAWRFCTRDPAQDEHYGDGRTLA